ncbi:CYTH domain-containing protein [Flavobacterium sp. GT3R68]|uniref:CYTH domain-containing protein n=1 Tax=Flavobacterium sp. GT3R68 TaxID=2594437 RepID=UPI000F876F67|nr:CYTH domain-containing protein [Flavobacterium sp. GT3R68]RTY95782.1 CYTH domain-containing protein [Flavobacterium sp. GSN2]TRW93553.1 CYTH domain-containing protein [Flavobacterium sp. GT3R68]
MIEIERKFLVTSEDFRSKSHTVHDIAQGYLNSNPNRTVRVRIRGEQAFLTVKGKGNTSGMSRFEWEKEIPKTDAQQLLLLCENGVIEKKRYEVQVGTHTYEVDVFFGNNEGLIIAEIELNSEFESFEKPNWLGQEVTNNERFYNAYLSQHPFTGWSK